MSRTRSATQAEPATDPRLRAGAVDRISTAVRDRRAAPPAPSVLEAEPANASARLGRRFGGRSPILVFGVTTLVGYLLLAALMVGVGFLLVDVLLPVHAIGHNDEAVNEWLASNRTPALNDASYVGSAIGDIPFIPALVILTALGALIMRRWRLFAFIVGAILVEVATYRVTSLIVHRERPTVPRLDPDHLPVNQSFPSGHVAASVVVYVGLALVISAKVRDRRTAIALWTLAIALPLIVALSRMYRGMHHPLDAFAGLLMGLAAITIALIATRAAGEAARVRAEAARR
jgi:membrane-associated phospholipid phosphatase